MREAVSGPEDRTETIDGRRKVLMVMPKMGFSGLFVKHAPIGLLYASVELCKREIPVEIFDQRLFKDSEWRQELKKMIDPEVVAVGISVWSGSSIAHSIEISEFVRSLDPKIKIIWGGPPRLFIRIIFLKIISLPTMSLVVTEVFPFMN